RPKTPCRIVITPAKTTRTLTKEVVAMSGETGRGGRHERRLRTWLGCAGHVRTARMRRAVLLTAAMVAAAVALAPAAGAAAGGPSRGPQAGAASARNAPAPGPFVTLLFSRSEISAADNCVEDDTSIARL